MSRRKRLILLVFSQVLLLLAMAGSYLAVDWVGREIRLKTRPVDPRDPFYGNYVAIRLDISDVPVSLWKGPGVRPPLHRPVHVVLTPGKDAYRVKGVYPEKPSVSGAEVTLKAKITDYLFTWVGDEPGGEQREPSENEARMHLDYGLERYYVPEGTGGDLERQSGNLIVRVKVAPWGQAKIIGVDVR